jgi:hypothetical protein
MEKSAVQIANAVAVIGIAASRKTTSEAATCECTGGKRGAAESKGNARTTMVLRNLTLLFIVSSHIYDVPCETAWMILLPLELVCGRFSAKPVLLPAGNMSTPENPKAWVLVRAGTVR